MLTYRAGSTVDLSEDQPMWSLG